MFQKIPKSENHWVLNSRLVQSKNLNNSKDVVLITDWYYTSPIQPNGHSRVSNTTFENVPFISDEDDFYPLLTNATHRLQSAWVNILQLHDKELYDHLVNMNILPTTFGINWTKLLFTRQFDDYCNLWDAVMVSKFTLVDYIVIAMVRILVHILET